VLRLAFLSPAVTDAILAGKVRSHVDVGALTATEAVSPSWAVQRDALLPAR
jgi:site-specific DNA recombinase